MDTEQCHSVVACRRIDKANYSRNRRKVISFLQKQGEKNFDGSSKKKLLPTNFWLPIMDNYIFSFLSLSSRQLPYLHDRPKLLLSRFRLRELVNWLFSPGRKVRPELISTLVRYSDDRGIKTEY